MRNPTVYLKMRVLGAVDMAEGDTEQKRLQAVSQMTFTDEDGRPRQPAMARVWQKPGDLLSHDKMPALITAL